MLNHISFNQWHLTWARNTFQLKRLLNKIIPPAFWKKVLLETGSVLYWTCTLLRRRRGYLEIEYFKRQYLMRNMQADVSSGECVWGKSRYLLSGGIHIIASTSFPIITKTTEYPPIRVATLGRLPNSIKDTAAIYSPLNQNMMIVKYSPCCSQLPWF